MRLASTGEGPFQWLVGAFYQDVDRQYGQNLPTPATTRSPCDSIRATTSAFFGAPPDTPYYSDLTYDFSSSRCSARRPTVSARSSR